MYAGDNTSQRERELNWVWSTLLVFSSVDLTESSFYVSDKLIVKIRLSFLFLISTEVASLVGPEVLSNMKSSFIVSMNSDGYSSGWERDEEEEDAMEDL